MRLRNVPPSCSSSSWIASCRRSVSTSGPSGIWRSSCLLRLPFYHAALLGREEDALAREDERPAVGGGERQAEEKSLDLVAPLLAQGLPLAFLLDPLRDDPDAEAVGERDHRRGH